MLESFDRRELFCGPLSINVFLQCDVKKTVLFCIPLFLVCHSYALRSYGSVAICQPLH